MSIAQQVQLRELSLRVSGIEASFRDAAEVGNVTARVDNLESAMSGVLLELQRLSKALAINKEAGKDPQGAQCPSSATTKSAPLSEAVSAAVSTAATRNSAQLAKTR